MKKILSLCLVFALCVSMLAGVTVPASAAYSGTCGENLTWTLDDNGTLTISGTGAMKSYSSYYSVPWYRDRDSIKTVVIKDGVTSIGKYAFYYCRALTSVTIPESVLSIGSYVFYECSALTSITIPESVTSIGNYAFYNCYSLTSVTIPDSVTSIGDVAFYSCNALTSVTIGDGVTSIGDYAFYECRALTSVTIGDGVTSIGEYAFFYCDSLTSVTIPDSVTSIGERAFYCCKSLTSVTIPDSVTSIGDSAFYYCTSLTSVTIGDSVTSIGDEAFYNCYSLTSVTIPDSVTSIGDYAFIDCDSLTSVTIPDSVTSIGERAFYSCNALTSVTIGDSVTSIGEAAFYSCKSLTSVTIGDSVTSIGEAAFSYCDSLTSVTIGDGVTSIGERAFYSCESLTSVTIGDGVTSIGAMAFCDCESLTSVTIGDSVTSIGNSAFYNCKSLTDVYYGGTVENRGGISIDSNNTPLTNATWHCANTYDILISSVSGGTVSSNKQTAVEGETVTLTATANAGYEFVTFLLDGTAISGNTFTMPNRAVTVSAEFVPFEYTVTVGEVANGSVRVDKSVAKMDEIVTVTAIADAGYEISKILVNGKEISGNTFTMPAGDVTVTAEIVKKVYPVTVEPNELGRITTDKSGATFGEVVTVTATPSAGYALSKIKVNGTKISGNMFIMPKAEVVVSAEFVADYTDYTITLGACENGSVSLDKNTANNGETVTVTATPDAGYELSKILVNGTAISGNTFTMPAEDVTVTATFAKKVYSITAIQPEEGIVMLDKQSATFGEIITVTTVPMIGYTVAKIKVNGVAIVGNTFEMPKSDVTVTVEFVLIPEVTLSTVNGAQIRTTGAQGLRFISSIDKTSLDFSRVVEYGTVLIPSADITDISELEIGAVLNGHAVAKVKANYMYDETDETVTFTAVLTNVAEKNYAREYTARAYAIMDDGSIVYAETGASRSIYAVAKRGLENPNESDANKEIFQAIVDTVENA